MSLGLLQKVYYQIIHYSIAFLCAVFTAKCSLKYLLVRNEKGNPLNSFKRLFWVFAILTNLFSISYYAIGISTDDLRNSSLRWLAELSDNTPTFFFFCMLITSLVIIEESIKMAIGKKGVEIKWMNFLCFLSIPFIVFLISLVFTITIFFTNVWFANKKYTRDGIFEFTYGIKAFLYTKCHYKVVEMIWSTVGILESLVFVLFLYRLVPALSIVYALMQRSEKTNKIKKAKLKEWVVFISLCCGAVLIKFIIAVLVKRDEKFGGKDGSSVWMDNNCTSADNEFLKGKNKKDYVFVKNMDFLRAVTIILIGIASSFIAPCRKVKKN